MPFDFEFSKFEPPQEGYNATFQLELTRPPEGGGCIAAITNVQGFDVDEPAPGQVYDPVHHEIWTIFTVVGQPLAPFSAVENMVTGWNNPNTMYGGRKVGFYLPPGTYQIEAFAVDASGNKGFVRSPAFTVVTPDSFYPGTRTVCFSNDPGETWAGEKSGCQRATTFSQLQNAVNNATGPLRILFKAGQTVPEASVSQILVNRTGQWLNHINRWGSGDDPIIECPFGGSGEIVFYFAGSNNGTVANEVEHFVCENIFFRGDWDAANEIGRPGRGPLNFRDHRNGTFYTIANLKVRGMNTLELSTNDAQVGNMVVANCDIGDWQDYGIYGLARTFAALLGCRSVQNVDAYNGGRYGKIGFFNDHTALRYPHSDYCYIAICDFFSRNGWSGLSPDQADQPCARMQQNGTTAHSFTDRVVYEGGGEPVAYSTEAQSFTEFPGNHVFNRGLLIASPKSWEAFILVEFGGTTVRNAIGIQLNTPDYHGNGWQGAIKLRAQQPGAGNLANPIRAYGNTFANYRNQANDPGDNWPVFRIETGFADVLEQNNILVAETIDTPVNPKGQINSTQTIPGVTCRYKGVLHYPLAWLGTGTLGSSVAPGGSVVLPYSGGTNQDYWATTEAIDTRHILRVGNTNRYAELGQITVAFEAGGIRFTNNTSSTWASGATWYFKLDRSSQKPAIPSTYSQFGATIPLPLPGAGALYSSGLIPFDSFRILGSEANKGRAGPSGTDQKYQGAA